MDHTAIQSSTPTPSHSRTLDGEAAPRPLRRRGPFWSALSALASLRLTVVLFSLAMVLVFCGTLAQRELGIWSAVDQYFRHEGIIWIPLKNLIFYETLPDHWPIVGGLGVGRPSFPFPGGFLIGGLLMANLLAAHLVRFRLMAKRSGILLLHAGLVVMMVGEFITAKYAVEGNMIIVEGSSSNFVQDSRNPELVIITPKDDKTDQVVAVPGSLLRSGSPIVHDLLPFDIEIIRYMRNSARPSTVKDGAENPATEGDGRFELAEERAEVTGTDPDQKVDYPSAYLKLTEKETGKDLGTYLVSLHYFVEDRPQMVKVGEVTYELTLRFKRSYKSYTMHLIKFNHELYPGTNTPKDFSSEVRLVDPPNDEDREVRIWMNNPLRYRGETFFQSSFLPNDAGTILQVVRNPGWLLPYLSCGMVSIGLLIHFGIGLVSFLQRRTAS